MLTDVKCHSTCPQGPGFFDTQPILTHNVCKNMASEFYTTQNVIVRDSRVEAALRHNRNSSLKIPGMNSTPILHQMRMTLQETRWHLDDPGKWIAGSRLRSRFHLTWTVGLVTAMFIDRETTTHHHKISFNSTSSPVKGQHLPNSAASLAFLARAQKARKTTHTAHHQRTALTQFRSLLGISCTCSAGSKDTSML